MADFDGRVLKFVSEKELEHIRETRGVRPEDGAVAVDKPLWEVLKEAKDAKDAEFNERFKHRPQRALDEDEVEFLEGIQQRQREHEVAVAREDSAELVRFKMAVMGRVRNVEATPDKVAPRDPPGEAVPRDENKTSSGGPSTTSTAGGPAGKPLEPKPVAKVIPKIMVKKRKAEEPEGERKAGKASLVQGNDAAAVAGKGGAARMDSQGGAGGLQDPGEHQHNVDGKGQGSGGNGENKGAGVKLSGGLVAYGSDDDSGSDNSGSEQSG
eukprot:jgi/Mesvir1/27383/Mv07188-RA.1